MNRLLGGGLTLGLAATASIALAAPSLAIPPFGPPYTPIDGQLSTDVVEPGGTITASSLDPCTTGPGVLQWSVYNERVGGVSSGEVPIGVDGAWSLEFTAPTEPGQHEFLAMCPPRPGGPPVTEPPTTTTTAPDDTVPDDTVPDDSVPGEVVEDVLGHVAGEQPATVSQDVDDDTGEAPAATTWQYGAEYYYLTFVVTAPPASPVVAQPTFTG